MASWTRLSESWFICEVGCFRGEGYKEERCDHSSDRPDDADDDARMNAAHWKRTHPDPTGLPHSFLCNYHYEELVLGIKHPQDEPVPEEPEAEWPSAEEFELFIGEVK